MGGTQVLRAKRQRTENHCYSEKNFIGSRVSCTHGRIPVA